MCITRKVDRDQLESWFPEEEWEMMRKYEPTQLWQALCLPQSFMEAISIAKADEIIDAAIARHHKNSQEVGDKLFECLGTSQTLLPRAVFEALPEREMTRRVEWRVVWIADPSPPGGEDGRGYQTSRLVARIVNLPKREAQKLRGIFGDQIRISPRGGCEIALCAEGEEAEVFASA